jgi:hypothetical protein
VFCFFVKINNIQEMLSCDLVCRACLHKNEGNGQIEFITEETSFQALKSVYTELTLLDVCFLNIIPIFKSTIKILHHFQVYDHDPLPKCLCSKCSELLQQFKAFKETCLQSDLTLRHQMLLDLKVIRGVQLSEPYLY